MIIWLAVALFAPWFAAHEIVLRCDSRSADNALVSLRVLLAIGFSMALSSCTYFLGLLIFGKPGLNYCIFEPLGFAAIGVACRLLPKVQSVVPSAAPIMRSDSLSLETDYPKLIRMAFIAALVVGLLGFVIYSALEPHGQYDAIALWNLRARSLFLLQDNWRNAFLPQFWHCDYPLLLSGSIARCWTYIGTDALWIPPFVAAVYTMATVGVIVAGVARLRGLNQGLLAGQSHLIPL